MDALIEQLEALMLEDDTTPAFQQIERFDVESLTEAFRLLLVSKQRICVIVALDEQFNPELESGKLVISRMIPIVLLISDRVLKSRKMALWGDPANANAPGAFALSEIALPAVTGQLIDAEVGAAGIISQPTVCQSIFLKDDEQKDHPGRAAVSLELHCTGGTLEAAVGPGPNL